jgi:Zn-dependent protease with chaperone function
VDSEVDVALSEASFVARVFVALLIPVSASAADARVEATSKDCVAAKSSLIHPRLSGSPAVRRTMRVSGFAEDVASSQASESSALIKEVLAFFESHGDQSIDAFLVALRPAPLSDAERRQVIATLPAKGAVQPTQAEGEKVAAARRVLDYSARAGAISITVFRDPTVDYAFVGLYFRTVVVASTDAVDLLDADELAALVAHELGHEYDWNDYWSALQRHDYGRMRRYELKSDGFAVLMLQRLGIDPGRLVSAVRKMSVYNDRKGTTDIEGYPALDERVAFIRAVARLRWADERSVVGAPR